MKSRKFKYFIFIFLFIESLPCFAGSFYSRHGIGLLRYRDGVKAAAMGGISFAITDSVSILFQNPATMAAINSTHIQGEFLYDRVGISVNSTEANFQDANVNGLGLLIPIKRGYSFALGLQPYSRSDLIFEGQDSTSQGVAYQNSLISSGGVDNIYLAFAGTIGQIRFGISGDFYFGLLKRTWNASFNDSTGLGKTEEELFTDFRGWGIHGGVQTNLGRWELGAVISSSALLTAETERNINTSDGAIGELDKRNLRVPLGYGVGVGYHPNPRFVVGAQARLQRWGDVDSDELLGASGVDSHTLGLGFEYIPTFDSRKGLFKRMQYRWGISHNRLPYKERMADKNTDENISEITFTGGFGLPFNNGSSRLDIAFEYGKRSGDDSDLVKETIFRVSASINGSERWFQRRNQR